MFWSRRSGPPTHGGRAGKPKRSNRFGGSNRYGKYRSRNEHADQENRRREHARHEQSLDLEDRVEILLKENGIEYEPGKKFETTVRFGKRKGEPNFRSVDFWLREPIWAYWFSNFPIQALEVKSGDLNLRCLDQQQELEEIGIYTEIITPQIVRFWENYGFLIKNGLYVKDNSRPRNHSRYRDDR